MNKTIPFEGFIHYQNCPQKYLFWETVNIDSPSKAFKKILDTIIAEIISHYLRDMLKESTFYVKKITEQFKNIFETDVKKYSDRANIIILTFLDNYIYNEKTKIVGLTIIESIAEMGIEVFARANFPFNQEKSGITTNVILSYSTKRLEYLDENYIAAAILKQGFFNRGINSEIAIHNLYSNEFKKYDSTNMHENIVTSLTKYLLKIKKNEFFYNVGNHCNYCEYRNMCAKEINK